MFPFIFVIFLWIWMEYLLHITRAPYRNRNPSAQNTRCTLISFRLFIFDVIFLHRLLFWKKGGGGLFSPVDGAKTLFLLVTSLIEKKNNLSDSRSWKQHLLIFFYFIKKTKYFCNSILYSKPFGQSFMLLSYWGVIHPMEGSPFITYQCVTMSPCRLQIPFSHCVFLSTQSH